ncbi:MAG TPA: transposase [Ktedonobacterales bacterium]|nr:transposase [Ktedonobacterales bacterium]
METVRIYRLAGLRPGFQTRLREAQMEAARVWTLCRDIHLSARQQHARWPNRDELQQATKGQFALHSQTVQMICHAFLANIETTRELRQTNPKIRYPYKDKRYYPLCWPAQAVSRERGRVVLPMGRCRASLVFHVDLPTDSGACKLVWNDGYELHVAVPVVRADAAPGQAQATVDLGEIHQAAVTTNTGAALVISGRGIRSLKRRHNMALGQIAKKRKRCQKGSRRWRKLQAARGKVTARKRRQIRDLRHKGTRAVITFCQQQGVGSLFIGNPHGVRNHNSGRHHNQRMSQWEYGQDMAYLGSKAKQSRIESFTGSERGTSSRCPICGWKQKVKGRVWRCRNRSCSFVGHRDVVGSANMHPLAFGNVIDFPAQVTYQRPGPVRVHRRDKQPLRVVQASRNVVAARTRVTNSG